MTNPTDALLAVEVGADAVGFVFGPSPRQVTPGQVADITRALPSQVEKIGLFANVTPEHVGETARIAGLTGVQLQGDESVEWVAAFRRLHPGFIIKTVWSNAGVDTLAERVAAAAMSADAVLIDSGSTETRGGTGRTFDWHRVRTHLDAIQDRVRVVVAGGLNPENVAAALATLRPWGVDVATGVERAPGHKDPIRVRAFVTAAKRTVL